MATDTMYHARETDRLSGHRWHVLRLYGHALPIHTRTPTDTLSNGYRYNVPCERDRHPQQWLPIQCTMRERQTASAGTDGTRCGSMVMRVHTHHRTQERHTDTLSEGYRHNIPSSERQRASAHATGTMYHTHHRHRLRLYHGTHPPSERAYRSDTGTATARLSLYHGTQTIGAQERHTQPHRLRLYAMRARTHTHRNTHRGTQIHTGHRLQLYAMYARTYTHRNGYRPPQRSQIARAAALWSCATDPHTNTHRHPQRAQMACAAALPWYTPTIGQAAALCYVCAYTYPQEHPQRAHRRARTASARATGTIYHRHGARASAATDGMCCGSIP